MNSSPIRKNSLTSVSHSNSCIDTYLLNDRIIVDENTILVCAILGTTYTGQYEDVKEIDRLLGEKNAREGLSVYIHVDGASGAFVAPFANPDLVWDFQLVGSSRSILDCNKFDGNSTFCQPHVCSINASGHKCKPSSLRTPFNKK
jgi:glutamate decarboxylase